MQDKHAYRGVLVLITLGFASDVASEPRREICEEWRDYYYNVETNEFIEWVGEPYWMCYPAGEPTSRPDGRSDDYAGGWGIPRDPKKPTCHQCKANANTCVETAEEGTASCLDHYRGWARSWCERYHTDIDNRLVDDFTCTPIEDPQGKPRQHCYGKGMDRCAESFENGSPVRTTEEGKSWVVKVLDFFDIGNNETTTVSYGGKKGFKDGCQEAERMAYDACKIQKDICQEEAGGCQ